MLRNRIARASGHRCHIDSLSSKDRKNLTLIVPQSGENLYVNSFILKLPHGLANIDMSE